MVWHYIKDRYLTWRTGLDKQARTWLKWEEENIVHGAATIEDMFVNFKYIIPVTTQIFNHAEPFGWHPTKEFREYMYPNREFGDSAVYYFARGYRDQWDGDQVFVATNNSQDAMMIALKYS